jgi:uncharacterized membrane protein required for colicin V production
MNIYDGIVVALLAIGAAAGYRRGLARSMFGLVSWGLSLALSYLLYPHAVRLLRALGLLGFLQDKLQNAMSLDFLAEGASVSAQMEMLAGLPQSELVLRRLQAGNNPEAYSLLEASGIKEYVCGFFANMIINLISLFLIWIAARLILWAVSKSLRAVERLPVIRAFNKAGGAAFGLAGAVFAIWAALCVLNLFFLDPNHSKLFLDISSGAVSGLFYSYNPLFIIISSILP